ncbi:nucleoporin NDC1 [Orussus abietinus]|uniref:nucleoporin NDC1 n=1 Tax=Orussus abietinus TaxID=222816 RepID=UPI000625A69E|nr:nucleoporin NDC1 [Orussus abietinus]
MLNGEKAGCKELLAKRILAAIISSIILQFFFTTCVILITNLSIVHPLSWLRDTWGIITRFETWSYYLALAVIIFLQGAICSRNYLNAPPCLNSRFAILCNIFMPRNLVMGSLYMVIGSTLVWLHLSLEDGRYGALTRSCDIKEGSCLVEEHYFLLLGGMWAGIYFFLKTNSFSFHYLQFPIIPQSKFSQVKRGIEVALPMVMLSAVWPTLYYLGIYFIFGAYLRNAALTTLFLHLENEPLSRITGLLSLSLIFHMWLYMSLFALSMNVMHIIFQAYLTQWIPFEVARTAVFSNETLNVTLPEALSMDKIPIIQHLGYLDLVTLSQKEKHRRAMLFTLSQPGGHPYNWNCIVDKCTEMIKSFTKELDAACLGRQDHVQVLAPSTLSKLQPMERSHAYHMRNLVSPKIVSPIPVERTVCKQSEQFILQYFQNLKQRLVNYLLSKPLIFYIFGEQTDSKVKHVLVKAQQIIWASDALSSIAVVSLMEDPYGIVQKDLPALISVLLALKHSLDKLQKINMQLVRKPQTDDRLIRQVITSLRSAVKRSVYRITSSFKDYILDLGLEPATLEQLQGFLSYRE